jgi:D-ribose pyranose/furanose isomerase RbsD
MKKMVMTNLIVQAMNSVANEMQIEELEEAEEVARQQSAESVEVGEGITKEAQEVPAENLVEISPSVEDVVMQDAEEEEND